MGRQYESTIDDDDGAVTVWDVFRQQWARFDRATPPSDEILASLRSDERDAVMTALDIDA